MLMAGGLYRPSVFWVVYSPVTSCDTHKLMGWLAGDTMEIVAGSQNLQSKHSMELLTVLQSANLGTGICPLAGS